MEKEFNIPGESQRWIFGKNVAANMDASLFTYGITNSGCPIFLYVKMGNENDDADVVEHGSNSTGKIFPITATATNTNTGTGSEINGDLFERDDDESVYESLQLPPYSSTEENKENMPMINERKINNITANINYIQNPLASLNLEVMNIVSSRTSFNENVNSVPTETTTTTTTTINSGDNLSKNYFYSETEDIPFKNEMVFESLNFVNEMLPRVDEENEDDLEEYNEWLGNDNPADEIKYIDMDDCVECAVKNTECFDCPICLSKCQPGNGFVLRACAHSFCR